MHQKQHIASFSESPHTKQVWIQDNGDRFHFGATPHWEFLGDNFQPNILTCQIKVQTHNKLKAVLLAWCCYNRRNHNFGWFLAPNVHIHHTVGKCYLLSTYMVDHAILALPRIFLNQSSTTYMERRDFFALFSSCFFNTKQALYLSDHIKGTNIIS